MVGGDGDGAGIGAWRSDGSAVRDGDIDPVGLVLTSTDAGVASFQGCRASAESRAGFRINKRDEGLGVGAGTLRWIAAAAVAGGAAHGEVVLAVEDEIGGWDGGSTRAGKRGGAQVDVG